VKLPFVAELQSAVLCVCHCVADGNSIGGSSRGCSTISYIMFEV
jgi:hypothetical protein